MYTLLWLSNEAFIIGDSFDINNLSDTDIFIIIMSVNEYDNIHFSC